MSENPRRNSRFFSFSRPFSGKFAHKKKDHPEHAARMVIPLSFLFVFSFFFVFVFLFLFFSFWLSFCFPFLSIY